MRVGASSFFGKKMRENFKKLEKFEKNWEKFDSVSEIEKFSSFSEREGEF